ncbi:molecular chaperone DnaJ [Strigomonas culicis]|uniref:Molecular chaperone DnaJ n=1 Tax=Strigomonas culicis TaxID=28005 RepID=S9TYL1_9TRYP|nr:molecular chaperone DnaJ [Strigomonas culicis]|eukprot:EPY21748.1 molecular chaperone DnaJ [Strigomonas culicis]
MNPRATQRLLRGMVLLLLVLHSTAALNAGSRKNKKAAAAAAEDGEVDYYRVLELQDRRETATDKEIRSQYRKLSKAYHPDLNHQSDTKVQYGRINRAYEVLSDKKRRKMYDLRGEEGLQQLERYLSAGPQQQQAFQNPFGQFFGGGGPAAGGLRGNNIDVEAEVGLDVLFTGGTHPLHLQKRRVCPACKGHGHPPDAVMRSCHACGGQGQVRQRVQLFPGMVQEMVQACPTCGGTGKTATTHCHRCRGEKFVAAQVTLPLELEQGTEVGQRIVFELEGEESLDKIPGDLVVRVRAAPHPVFSPRHPHLQQQHQVLQEQAQLQGGAGAPPRNPHSVEDSNTYLDLDTFLEVSLREALVGFRRELTHLDGTPVVVEVPEGDVTPFDAELRLVGKGFPKLHVPSERGDLYVKVGVKLPTSLTAEQAAWVRENL